MLVRGGLWATSQSLCNSPCASGSVCHWVMFDCGSEWFSFSPWPVFPLPFGAQDSKGDRNIFSSSSACLFKCPRETVEPRAHTAKRSREGVGSTALSPLPIRVLLPLLVPTWGWGAASGLGTIAMARPVRCQVLGCFMAIMAVCLPVLRELPSQGAQQKLWQMDLRERMELFQMLSPGAERALAVRLRCRAAQGCSSPVGKSLSHSCLPAHLLPSFKEQGRWPLTGVVCVCTWQGVGGWKETAVPYQPSAHPISEPTVFPPFLPSPSAPCGYWREALKGQSGDNHRHTGLISRGGT